MSMRNEAFNKVRRLTLLLMASGAINIFLVALLGYIYFKERPPNPICERMPHYSAASPSVVIECSNSDLVRMFKNQSLENLIEKLHDRRLVNDGFTLRDLAFGCLITYHHFDMVSALKGAPLPRQTRTIAYRDDKGERHEITTYSDLTEKHYEKIINFASTERWPLTAQGLFMALQKQQGEKSKNLKYAFFLTPEFLAVDLLLKRSSVDVERSETLELLLEGDWSLLADFAEKQRISQDLSQEMRRQFLFSYIEKGSTVAANLILKTDPFYTTKKLDDDHVLAILKHLKRRTPEAARFALEILASPRRDAVWQEAADRLYTFAGEEKPKEYHRNNVLARFLPLAVRKKEEKPFKRVDRIVAHNLEDKKPPPAAKPTATPAKKPTNTQWKRAYTVKSGDSLWKIGRMFNVDITELKSRNNITTDALAPGTLLIVP